MKTFFKVFAISFLCFTVTMGAGLWAFSKFYHAQEKETESIEVVENEEKQEENKGEDIKQYQTELEKLIHESSRTNILLLGMEGVRTDTIVLASFDKKSKNLDLISVPRDTYYERREYRAADKQKINAVYGDSGIKGTKRAISEVLNIPIDYYVKVTYKGVEKIVDSLGGVEVNIPVKMDYDDPYDKPPLHIHFNKGRQVLNGKNAVKFLRFRKGNKGGGYPDGDLGRMKAQQQFMKNALKKAFGFRLPVVANTVVQYVDTDIPLSQIAILAKDAVGMDMENIEAYSLPGEAIMKKLSYFIPDEDEVEELMKQIYKRGKEE
ncbi:LCP family protein [Inediibacterium massiliense]|uniref:LCP family protein n=1 Tax=Inediibacterium massiliense TaxID=1658111 RepID=UPI0006B415CC|nr:LCP family protein [Inediibacterium massiliense]